MALATEVPIPIDREEDKQDSLPSTPFSEHSKESPRLLRSCPSGTKIQAFLIMFSKSCFIDYFCPGFLSKPFSETSQKYERHPGSHFQHQGFY